jgi:hypothetical protein
LGSAILNEVKDLCTQHRDPSPVAQDDNDNLHINGVLDAGHAVLDDDRRHLHSLVDHQRPVAFELACQQAWSAALRPPNQDQLLAVS